MARIMLIAILLGMAAAAPKSEYDSDCFYKTDKDAPANEVGNEKGRSYRGLVSFTVSGSDCKKWTDSVDHLGHREVNKTTGKTYRVFETKWAFEKPTADRENSKGIMHWGNGLGNHNYCRNPSPDKMDSPWCFTVDGKKELCNIRECEPPRSFKGEVRAMVRKMKTGNLNCDCGEQLYGNVAGSNKMSKDLFKNYMATTTTTTNNMEATFLEEEHMGRTQDGRPCKCR